MDRDKDIFDAESAAREVLGLIANKWSAMVILRLADGKKRYNQLQRDVGGISQKMLTQTLRRLERDGLVEREAHPVVPPRVEYSLTPLGRTLVGPLNVFLEWTVAHLDDLRAARTRYEEASQAERP